MLYAGAAGQKPTLPPELEDARGEYKVFLLWAENSNQIRIGEMVVHICLRSAERVELLGTGAALLDMGSCTAGEVRSLVGSLLSYLAGQSIVARAGIGPTGIVAQLAYHLGWITGRPVPLVSAGERSAFLHAVPSRLILDLYPRGIIYPDLVARLDQYGLQTLGQLARLEKPVLCRQFGMAAGTFLHAVASGDDPYPFSPTSDGARHALRLRFAAPASPSRLLATLPYLSRSAAALLVRSRTQARRLRIRLGWVETGREQISTPLRQPIADSRLLAEELNRMALLLLTKHAGDRVSSIEESEESEEIAELQLFLEELIPANPWQQLLWADQTQAPSDPRQQKRKRAALQAISRTLARRYSRSRSQSSLSLFHPHLSYPDAIFPEERYSKAGIS